ncbi:MAG: helix-turn-helix domain-containing protein [Synechococcaceae bacterium WB8_1A_041]|nr:helix-turn-helix domain-containing protein [Synechococcaceae bacterium WB8_1A_041]NDD21230.1 helix-turn-helix domain-containing protein [Synechococcaceae bacterium WBA_3_309]NDE22170.1 helix-turn-helix domain-containing protein [Synechococcaceae bacterium WB9_3_282]NDG00294.1 helix-turn-helix domain-containing protein [Synechococcaceae bacterium WBB_32_011]
MAASRLNNSQKQELVQRYQAGEASAALAEAFECSTNTVSRTVKAALGIEAYAALKEQRAKGTVAINPEQINPEPINPEPEDQTTQNIEEMPVVLALDDADDFALNQKEDSESIDLEIEQNNDFFTLPLLAVEANLSDSNPCVSKPLVTSELPASLYLLVDREVELKGTPVKEFSELGRVAPQEEDLQAIALFVNPRQAKRQCGRSQRVIKVPDSSLLDLTAPYILAQGISRIVLEGALYAIPGSAG